MGDVIVSAGLPEIPMENGRSGGAIVFADGDAPHAATNMIMVETVCKFIGTIGLVESNDKITYETPHIRTHVHCFRPHVVVRSRI